MSNKIRLFGCAFLVSAILGAGAPPAQAANLTADQVSAFLTFLRSFNVDQQTITNVSNILGGTGGAFCYSFTSNLSMGMRGPEVMALQQALIANGLSVPAGATGFFGGQTKSAVIIFQQKYASEILTPNGFRFGTGVVGPATRAKLNTLFICSQTTLGTSGSGSSHHSSGGGGSSGTGGTSSVTPTITVTYPQTNYVLANNLSKSTIATITWTSTHADNLAVTIKLKNASGTVVKTLASGIANSGSYDWPVDISIPGGDYAIAISTQSGVVGESGLFTLSTNTSNASPTITQISPTSGPVGTVVTVTGTNFGAASYVDLVPLSGSRTTISHSGVTVQDASHLKFTMPSITTGLYYMSVVCSHLVPLGGCPVSNSNSFLLTTSNQTSPFSFSLYNGGAKSVTQGSLVTQTATAQLGLGSTPQPVTFSASNLPSGVTASFGLNSCTPNTSCTTTMNISASSSAVPGTYLININGSGGGTNHVISFALTVLSHSVTLGNTADQTAGALNGIDSSGTIVPSQSAFTYTWDHDLQIGSPYMADVSALQMALKLEGVYSGDITGGFYSQTFSAVQLFQQKYGIDATGYVGSVTRERLNALY